MAGLERALLKNILTLEFDPSSGRTLAACLKHASRTDLLLAQSNFSVQENAEHKNAEHFLQANIVIKRVSQVIRFSLKCGAFSSG